MNEKTQMSRRSFLDVLLKGGATVWAVAFLAPVASYLWPAQKRGPSNESISVGKPDEFADGQAKMAALNGSPIIVLKTPQGFRAFSAICTHLGCIVAWDAAKGQIACPCHAGFFNTDGKPVSGPPPRPLQEFKVAVLGGEVKVMSA
jgi:cytochrome b6-f complex iron-sulfur subunit